MSEKVNFEWLELDAALKIKATQVHITPKRPFRFRVRLQKAALPALTPGVVLPARKVILDEKEPLQNLKGKAASFKEISEKERVNLLLDLVRSNLIYASLEEIERLDKDNPELGQWLRERLISEERLTATLSDYIENGYGRCEQFASLFAVLAQSAGLEVIINGRLKSLINIIRPDNGEPLFKTVPLGVIDASHTWNEVKLGNRWIPVDPTTNLNGLDKVQRKIFKEANYLHDMDFPIDIKCLERDFEFRPVFGFKPGQREIRAPIKVFSRKLIPETRNEQVSVPTKIYREYQGDLEFVIRVVPFPMCSMGIKIIGVEV